MEIWVSGSHVRMDVWLCLGICETLHTQEGFKKYLAVYTSLTAKEVLIWSDRWTGYVERWLSVRATCPATEGYNIFSIYAQVRWSKTLSWVAIGLPLCGGWLRGWMLAHCLYTWRVSGLLRCVQRCVLVGCYRGAGEGVDSHGSTGRRHGEYGLSSGLLARLWGHGGSTRT